LVLAALERVFGINAFFVGTYAIQKLRDNWEMARVIFSSLISVSKYTTFRRMNGR